MDIDDAGKRVEKTVTVPIPEGNGKQIDVCIAYTNEYDTNVTIYDEEGASVIWTETGDNLTWDELNTEIFPNTTLWEWIMEEI